MITWQYHKQGQGFASCWRGCNVNKQAAITKAHRLSNLIGCTMFVVYQPSDDYDTSPEHPYTVCTSVDLARECVKDDEIVQVVEPENGGE